MVSTRKWPKWCRPNPAKRWRPCSGVAVSGACGFPVIRPAESRVAEVSQKEPSARSTPQACSGPSVMGTTVAPFRLSTCASGRGPNASTILGQFLGKEAFKGVKVHGLELAKALHPDAGVAQGVGFQFAPFHAAALFLADEARAGEDAEVFGDGGKAFVERVGHVGHGHVILKQHGQNGPPGGIGECVKNGIEV